MRSYYGVVKKVAAYTLILTLTVLQSNARTYLAVASGNFSNTATWGGTAPIEISQGDEMIIPAGITVTMDADLSIDGVLTLDAGVLDMNGYKLNFGSEGDLQVYNAGALNATQHSELNIISANGFTGNLAFTAGSKIGNITINTATDEGIYLGSDIIVTGKLSLQSGILYLNNHELFIAGNGDFASTGNGVLSSTSVSDIGIFTNNNLSSPLRFSRQGNTVRNFTVNCANERNVIRVDAHLYVTGALVLASGRLDMGDRKLTLMRRGAMLANPASYTSGQEISDARSKASYYTANSHR